jgi:hypothetical protein
MGETSISLKILVAKREVEALWEESVEVALQETVARPT